MTFFYIGDDFENDVRRCIRSWERQDLIMITGATIEGEIKEFIGTVQTIDRDPGRAEGRLWRVMIREHTPSSQVSVQRVMVFLRQRTGHRPAPPRSGLEPRGR